MNLLGICITGLHATAEEAARAYDKKAIELHGNLARTNFPINTTPVTPVHKQPDNNIIKMVKLPVRLPFIQSPQYSDKVISVNEISPIRGQSFENNSDEAFEKSEKRINLYLSSLEPMDHQLSYKPQFVPRIHRAHKMKAFNDLKSRLLENTTFPKDSFNFGFPMQAKQETDHIELPRYVFSLVETDSTPCLSENIFSITSVSDLNCEDCITTSKSGDFTEEENILSMDETLDFLLATDFLSY